jgi:hypothetical protein
MTLPRIGGFSAPPGSDYASLVYTGDDLTQVVYKSGGSTGEVLGTLELTYSTGKLVSIGWV